MSEKTSPFLEMNAAPTPPERKRTRMLGALIALVILAILSAAVWYRLEWNNLIRLAVVDGVRTAVVAASDGQVVALRVNPGQLVTQGQPMIVVRPVPGSGGEADTRAALETLRAQLGTGEDAERRARADIEQASLVHARAQVAMRGAGQPVSGSAASVQEHERLRADERKAAAALEAAKTRFDSTSTARQATERAYRQIREALLAAEARKRDGAQGGQAVQPEESVLTAPSAGRVGAFGLEPGMSVSRGQTLAVIESVLPEHLWITGFVQASRLTDLDPEQVFSVRVAGQPDAKLTARVEAILPVRPGEQAAGVPVRLRLLGYDPLTMPRLEPGMSAEVRKE